MYVFVYGTLTDPARVDRVLTGHRYALEDDAILEGVHRVEGQYPTLAPGGSVDGRLLEVDSAALAALDRYEGVENGLYARVSIPFRTGGASAATYVGDPARLGLGEPDWWPAGSSFQDRVRTLLERVDPVVQRRE
ncbi:gamma-glutamylcyclotransferase [Salinadaptatus halalkaliphilus]|uniref:Gamma-glutamylcyclotransferase n=1 Tax=Salinadaptatus halalkaliphilus TaxID=2419781 RepID=A0A4S3TK48_9EURY|nr:gamma-glutamylcyclotransferase family protein [Salinadaptatus halalkaliphilus]THE63940.1 gamma-glutamylcyclotransferase [Salinadaptatus halalkaliphilus]